jgi:hypothetical protein
MTERRRGFLGGIDWVKEAAGNVWEATTPVRKISGSLLSYTRSWTSVSGLVASAGGFTQFVSNFDYSHPLPIVAGIGGIIIGGATFATGAMHLARTARSPLSARGTAAKLLGSQESAEHNMGKAGTEAAEYNRGVQDLLRDEPRPDSARPHARAGFDRAGIEEVQQGPAGLKAFAQTCQDHMDAQEKSQSLSSEPVSAEQSLATLTAAPNAPPIPQESGTDGDAERSEEGRLKGTGTALGVSDVGLVAIAGDVDTSDQAEAQGDITGSAAADSSEVDTGTDDASSVPQLDAPSESELSDLPSDDTATTGSEIGASEVEARYGAADGEAADTTGPTSAENQTEMSDLPDGPEATASENTGSAVDADLPASHDPRLDETQVTSEDSDPAREAVEAGEDVKLIDAGSVSAAETAPELTETTTELPVAGSAANGEEMGLDPAETANLGDSASDPARSSPSELESSAQEQVAVSDASNNADMEANPGTLVTGAQESSELDAEQKFATTEIEPTPGPDQAPEPEPEAATGPDRETDAAQAPEPAPETEAAAAPAPEPQAQLEPEAAPAPAPAPAEDPDTDDPEPSM